MLKSGPFGERIRSLRWPAVVIAVAVVAAFAAHGGSAPRTSSVRTAPTHGAQPRARPHPHPARKRRSAGAGHLTPPQILKGYEQSTAVTCSPIRRTEALLYGAGSFCVPWNSIPAIHHPKFVRANGVRFLAAADPVAAFQQGEDARAYPVVTLDRHEVVNDVVRGLPVVITFCPLCNSAVAFSRRVAGKTLTFGVSGQLGAAANLRMFDFQTISIWQQITGIADAGPLAGKRLRFLPANMESFGVWRAAHPKGKVLIDPGYGRADYRHDPYWWYDQDPTKSSILLRSPENPDSYSPTDPRLLPKWRVVATLAGGRPVAFPSPRGPGRAAVEVARSDGVPLVAFFRYGLALPERAYALARAPRGWSGGIWLSRLGGRVLHFVSRGRGFLETTTGSRFTFDGLAVSGPLAGRTLQAVPQVTAFWFAWSYVHPRTFVAPFPAGSPIGGGPPITETSPRERVADSSR